MGKRKGKLLFGVGLYDSNDATSHMVDGVRVRCPYYQRWYSILRACYSEDVQLKNPSYRGCYVCEEWKIFSNFKSWMEKQEWEGLDIFRDFPFGDSKCYSPETCIFIPTRLNGVTNIRNKKDSSNPLGVVFVANKKKFRAYITQNNKTNHIGYYDNPLEAHFAWMIQKIELLKLTAEEFKDNKVIYNGINLVISKIDGYLKKRVELVAL